MKIKKLGHCCLYIEVKGLKALTDPGVFSTSQDELTGLDLILITHEHQDHLHVESLKNVLKNNREACVVSNSSVGKILDKEGIKYTLLEGTSGMTLKDVALEAHDGKHEEIYEEFGQVQNTGYFIDEKLFYPGDSFHNPQKPVDILALPVAGPWCRIGDAIRYALEVKPRVVFPVHDAVVSDVAMSVFHMMPESVLTKEDIEFVSLKAGEEKEF